MRIRTMLMATICVALPVTARAQSQVNISQTVDIMVRLCIAGGQQFEVTTGGNAGADVSLRSRDVTGNLSGNFQFKKSQAEGLVNGIDRAISQVQADEADKVRDCLAPVRQAILTILLGVPPKTGQNSGQVSGWRVTFSARGAGGGEFGDYGSKTVMVPKTAAIDIRDFFPANMSGRNVDVSMTATTDQQVVEPGQWIYFVKLNGSPQSYTDCVSFEIDSDGIPISNPGRHILAGQNLTFGASGLVDQSLDTHVLTIKLDCFIQARQFPVVTVQMKTPNGAWRWPGASEFAIGNYVNPNVPPGEQ